jgi:hypothetical protein
MSFFRQFPKVTYNFLDSGFDTTITDIFRFVQADLPAISDNTTYEFYQIMDGDRPDIVSNKLYGTPDYYWTFFICNEHLKTGLTGWPMSQNQFDKYILTEYDGIALITKPTVDYNTDFSEVLSYSNSLSGAFNIGETVTTGLNPNLKTTGTIYYKDANLSQLIIRNIVETGGPFRAHQEISGTQAPISTITPLRVVDWKDAPHHYLKQPIYDNAGNLLSEPTISYNGLFIGERDESGHFGGDTPPDVTDLSLTAVSNLQYETELNDIRSKIRVVRPKLIYSFAQAYKKLLNA